MNLSDCVRLALEFEKIAAMPAIRRAIGAIVAVVFLAGCQPTDAPPTPRSGEKAVPRPTATNPTTAPASATASPRTSPSTAAPPTMSAGNTTTSAAGSTANTGSGTVAGNTSGPALPTDARPVDTSKPTTVIGDGTPASCTSEAVVKAVAKGGVIVFRCGSQPVTIPMSATAKVVNTSPDVVIDGGGLVTLDGLDKRRILYLNTCDKAQVWTTSHCQNQAHPTLTVQGLTFTRGNATGQTTDGGGGGAVFVRGGRFMAVDSVFTSNRCEATGPDVGGGAIRVLSQYQGKPAIVSRSTFTSNRCSNGGATSSIGVSWRIHNSVFTSNTATGRGANPARSGTPGGGNGGAIYLDGRTMTLELVGSVVRDNVANEGGGAIFFVSNDRTGRATIRSSTLTDNPSRGFETKGYPGVFHLGSGAPIVTDSKLS